MAVRNQENQENPGNQKQFAKEIIPITITKHKSVSKTVSVPTESNTMDPNSQSGCLVTHFNFSNADYLLYY